MAPRFAAATPGLLIAVAIAIGLPACRGPEQRAPEAPSARQVTRDPGLEFYPSLSPDGERIAWAAEREGRFELLVAARDGSGVRALTSDGFHNVQPAWSPDGRRIAYFSRGRGGIWTVPAEGGVPVQVSAFGARAAWSPDGKWIAFQSEPQVDVSYTSVVPLPPCSIWVVAATGGEPRQVTRPGRPAGGHGTPAWTPDGSEIVFVAYDRVGAALWRVRPDGQGLRRMALPADQPSVSDPASCPGCDAIYYVSYAEPDSSGIWKLRLGAEQRGPEWVRAQLVGSGLQRVRHLSLSRDGKRLAFAAVAAEAHLASLPLDPATSLPAGPPRPLTSGEGRHSRPAFSPDGRRIAYTRVADGARSDVWIASADGRDARPLTSDPGTDTMPSWFPDGQRVAFVSDRGGHPALWVADVRDGRATPLRDIGQPIDAPRLAPDGLRVAFNWAPGGGPINVWSMPLAGGAPRQLTDDPEMAGFPAWAPDGRALAVQVKRGDETHVALLELREDGRPVGPPRQLTRGPGLHWTHSWSPDGDKAAFVALRGGTAWNVGWVSRAGEQRTLTDYRSPGSYVRYPAWSPRGDRIVYEFAETRADIWTVETP
jgi:Tol biopolymer transport system component